MVIGRTKHLAPKPTARDPLENSLGWIPLLLSHLEKVLQTLGRQVLLDDALLHRNNLIHPTLIEEGALLARLRSILHPQTNAESLRGLKELIRQIKEPKRPQARSNLLKSPRVSSYQKRDIQWRRLDRR